MLPDVIAMLFADDVHRDSATGKYFVLGTHSSVGAPFFPWTHPALVVYLALAGEQGKTPLKFRLIDEAETQPPLFEADKTVWLTDPKRIVEVGFFEPNVVFPAAGNYRLQLWHANQVLRERTLRLHRSNVNGRPKPG